MRQTKTFHEEDHTGRISGVWGLENSHLSHLQNQKDLTVSI